MLFLFVCLSVCHFLVIFTKIVRALQSKAIKRVDRCLNSAALSCVSACDFVVRAQPLNDSFSLACVHAVR